MGRHHHRHRRRRRRQSGRHRGATTALLPADGQGGRRRPRRCQRHDQNLRLYLGLAGAVSCPVDRHRRADPACDQHPHHLGRGVHRHDRISATDRRHRRGRRGATAWHLHRAHRSPGGHRQQRRADLVRRHQTHQSRRPRADASRIPDNHLGTGMEFSVWLRRRR